MAQVDPEDDSRSRWILRWYRFDQERNEGRPVTVAAYTRKSEFNRAFSQLSRDLEQRKQLGLSAGVEYVSGVLHEQGHLERVGQARLRERLIRQSWKQRPLGESGTR